MDGKYFRPADLSAIGDWGEECPAICGNLLEVKAEGRYVCN